MVTHTKHKNIGLNIFYFKITLIIQTNMTYTQIGLERKHKLFSSSPNIHIYKLYYIMVDYHHYKDYLFNVDNAIY